MKTPQFIQEPFGEPVLKTASLLVKDLAVKQIAVACHRSDFTIQDHTKIIRRTMQCSTIYGALARMYAVGLITREQLIVDLPKEWQPFIQPAAGALPPLLQHNII